MRLVLGILKGELMHLRLTQVSEILQVDQGLGRTIIVWQNPDL